MGKFDLLGVDCRWKMKWQAKDERLVRDNLFRLYSNGSGNPSVSDVLFIDCIELDLIHIDPERNYDGWDEWKGKNDNGFIRGSIEN